MMTRAFFAVLAAAALLAPGTASAASFNWNDLTDLFVFGDSIVDTGNTNLSTGGTSAPAAAGYFMSRFTNGINLADRLNRRIEGTDIGANGLAFGLPSGAGDNFAWGGARARDNSPADTVPDLETQVLAFAGWIGGPADPDALYVINAGGNDIFDALTIAGGGGSPFGPINAATDAIEASVLTLQGLGAQNILVMGVGDVGSTPGAIASGTAVPGRSFSELLNAQIEARLGLLAQPVDFFDTIAFQDAVIADPSLFGLPDPLTLLPDCLTAFGMDVPACNDFAWFDPIHPTSPLLQALGSAVIPEPGTALLLGAGLVGLAVRRRTSA